MARKQEDTAPYRLEPRESDNPILEEYKEEMLRRPTFGARSTLNNDERLYRMEGLLAELLQKIEVLERRIDALEGRKTLI